MASSSMNISPLIATCIEKKIYNNQTSWSNLGKSQISVGFLFISHQKARFVDGGCLLTVNE